MAVRFRKFSQSRLLVAAHPGRTFAAALLGVVLTLAPMVQIAFARRDTDRAITDLDQVGLRNFRVVPSGDLGFTADQFREVAAIPSGFSVVGLQRSDLTVMRYSGGPPIADATAAGLLGDLATLGPQVMSAGRDFSAEDRARCTAVAVVGASVATSLGIRGSLVRGAGQSFTLDLGGASWTIVGVLRPFTEEPMLDTLVLIPCLRNGNVTTVLGRSSRQGVIASATLSAQLFRGLPTNPAVVSIPPLQLAAAYNSALVRGRERTRRVIGSAFVTGGLALCASVFLSTRRRRGELALRRAIGATYNQVYISVLGEWAVVIAIGSMLGVQIAELVVRRQHLERYLATSDRIHLVGLTISAGVAMAAIGVGLAIGESLVDDLFGE